MENKRINKRIDAANITWTTAEFFELFPDDEKCLEYLMKSRFGKTPKCPKCQKVSKFHRVTRTPAFACQWCGHHIHPMAGTPFQDSRTPLQKWFYVMYLFTSTRHGVAAKEIQRQLGVTYKCAWRMGHEIRKYMGKVDGDKTLGGHVEVDETLVGGETHTGKQGPNMQNKTIVFGMVERGGAVETRVVKNRKTETLQPEIMKTVAKGATISSDDWGGYGYLGTKGYRHGIVNHSGGEYVRGSIHTNTIEGFWSRLKNSIKGTHVHVSEKHLAKYLGEFEFRYNLRKKPRLMFDRLLTGF